MQSQVARPTRTVDAQPDAWAPAGDNDAAAYLCDAIGIDLEDLRDGRRRWRVNNRLNYYRYLARKFYATGRREIRTTRETIARNLYDDVSSIEDMRRKARSLVRCEKDLVAAGLIHVEPILGKGGGLLITIRNPTSDGYTPPSRGCSSVG